MTTHEEWMAMAIAEARAAALIGDAPTAAVIVQRGALLAVGRNTKTADRSGFAHAELNALLAAKDLLGRRPAECCLYSTLEPCAMCLGAITFSGIRTVVYGAPDPAGGATAMFARHPTYRVWMPQVHGDVLREECEALQALPEFGGHGERSARG